MTAKFFTHVCDILGVKNVFTTAYHPQTNGQVEQFNRTILASLRHFVADHPKEWDLYAETVAFGYNTQAHATTTLTPFDMVVSRPILPVWAEPVLPQIIGDARELRMRWAACGLSATSISGCGQRGNNTKRVDRCSYGGTTFARSTAQTISWHPSRLARSGLKRSRTHRRHP